MSRNRKTGQKTTTTENTCLRYELPNCRLVLFRKLHSFESNHDQTSLWAINGGKCELQKASCSNNLARNRERSSAGAVVQWIMQRRSVLWKVKQDQASGTCVEINKRQLTAVPWQTSHIVTRRQQQRPDSTAVR